MTNETPNPPREELGVVLTPDQARNRRARNIAIGLSVAAFIVLFYVVTIVKLGGNVAHLSN